MDWTTGLDYWSGGNCLDINIGQGSSAITLRMAMQVAQFMRSNFKLLTSLTDEQVRYVLSLSAKAEWSLEFLRTYSYKLG